MQVPCDEGFCIWSQVGGPCPTKSSRWHWGGKKREANYRYWICKCQFVGGIFGENVHTYSQIRSDVQKCPTKSSSWYTHFFWNVAVGLRNVQYHHLLDWCGTAPTWFFNQTGIFRIVVAQEFFQITISQSMLLIDISSSSSSSSSVFFVFILGRLMFACNTFNVWVPRACVCVRPSGCVHYLSRAACWGYCGFPLESLQMKSASQMRMTHSCVYPCGKKKPWKKPPNTRC